MFEDEQSSPISPSVAKQALGTHILLELNDCPDELLLDKELLERELVEAAEHAGAHVVKPVFHQFSPHGLSGVVVIAESHIAIHTWPEHRYAAVDIFTCGDPVVAKRIQREIVDRFAPAKAKVRSLERGPEQGSPLPRD